MEKRLETAENLCCQVFIEKVQNFDKSQSTIETRLNLESKFETIFHY